MRVILAAMAVIGSAAVAHAQSPNYVLIQGSVSEGASREVYAQATRFDNKTGEIRACISAFMPQKGTWLQQPACGKILTATGEGLDPTKGPYSFHQLVPAATTGVNTQAFWAINETTGVTVVCFTGKVTTFPNFGLHCREAKML